jgi:hypothetical protein
MHTVKLRVAPVPASAPHDDGLREVIDLIRAGLFSRGDTALLRPLIDDLLDADPYMVMTGGLQ